MINFKNLSTYLTLNETDLQLLLVVRQEMVKPLYFGMNYGRVPTNQFLFPELYITLQRIVANLQLQKPVLDVDKWLPESATDSR